MSKITIMGAGGVGTAAAADLTLAGHEVVLYEMPRFHENIDPIMESGGISLAGVGRTGFARVAKVTTDIAEAVSGTPVIMIATVGWAHETIAKLCAPYLEDGQTIILLSAQFGSLEFSKALKEKRPDVLVKIAETVSAPYVSRRTASDKAEVVMRMHFHDLGLAALPGRDTSQVMDEIKVFYPDTFIAGRNVAEIGLSNINILGHPGPVLLMTGWIEATDGDVTYSDGFTPSVLKVVEATFQEKNAILKSMGLRELYSFEQLKKYVLDPEIRQVKGPPNMNHRFVTEDCPLGLVALTSFGDLAGVPTPVCKAIITLVSEMMGRDYPKEGRTPERMGISRLNLEQLNKFLDEG
jgi:opine dehydrogenase